MMLWVFIIVSCMQFHVFHINALFLPQVSKLPLPSGAIGPNSYAFDARGKLHTGVQDGRILKLQGPNVNFTEFATISSFRKPGCGDFEATISGPKCPRPLGLGFYYQTGQLYITGGTAGFLVVGPDGGPATQIATNISGTPFNSIEALDIDQTNGVVYFADSGFIFSQTTNVSKIILSGDTTGKLLKYDPRTKQISQLIRGLSGPTGVVLSASGSYILVTESITKRIQRFWLKGPRSGTFEVFKKFEGYPVSITRTIIGDFWVAVNDILETPNEKQLLGQRISVLGTVVLSLNFTDAYINSPIINQVSEYFGSLYIGSLDTNFVGRYGF